MPAKKPSSTPESPPQIKTWTISCWNSDRPPNGLVGKLCLNSLMTESRAKGRIQRPAFDKLFRMIQRREIDVVMAWSIDRLGVNCL
jgi:hypothetical protein